MSGRTVRRRTVQYGRSTSDVLLRWPGSRFCRAVPCRAVRCRSRNNICVRPAQLPSPLPPPPLSRSTALLKLLAGVLVGCARGTHEAQAPLRDHHSSHEVRRPRPRPACRRLAHGQRSVRCIACAGACAIATAELPPLAHKRGRHPPCDPCGPGGLHLHPPCHVCRRQGVKAKGQLNEEATTSRRRAQVCSRGLMHACVLPPRQARMRGSCARLLHAGQGAHAVGSWPRMLHGGTAPLSAMNCSMHARTPAHMRVHAHTHMYRVLLHPCNSLRPTTQTTHMVRCHMLRCCRSRSCPAGSAMPPCAAAAWQQNSRAAPAARTRHSATSAPLAPTCWRPGRRRSRRSCTAGAPHRRPIGRRH